MIRASSLQLLQVHMVCLKAFRAMPFLLLPVNCERVVSRIQHRNGCELFTVSFSVIRLPPHTCALGLQSGRWCLVWSVAFLPRPNGSFPVFHFVFSNHPSLRGIEVNKRLSVNAIAAFLAINPYLFNRWRNECLPFFNRGVSPIYILRRSIGMVKVRFRYGNSRKFLPVICHKLAIYLP